MSTKKNPTPDLRDMIETKITRSEAIDIMLDSLRSEFEARLKALEEERHVLFDVSALEVLSALIEESPGGMTDAKVTVKRSWSKQERAEVTFEFAPQADTVISRLMKREAGLRKEESDCREVLRKVNGKESKSFLLKQMIGQTLEGQAFLRRMEGMTGELRRVLALKSTTQRLT